VALVIPNRRSVQSLAKELDKSDDTFEQLCENPLVVETILKDITESGIQYRLNKREIPLKVRVCPEEWSPDNGMLTAAMKLKRVNIVSKYRSEIDEMFS
jgi:long-chain acyl-CoA synthetase